jgi:hypothetical protein
MAMRPALFAAVLAVLAPATCALAQPAPSPHATDQASLSHSALKATTFKAGTVVANLAILSYATGLAGGAALTTFITASAWVFYTANDYLWDTYSPPPARENTNQAFDATADAWRNTEKYLTYKPVIASVKLGSLYLYTGSVAAMTVFGTASVLTSIAVFYANNMAGDWYSTAPTVAAAKP